MDIAAFFVAAIFGRETVSISERISIKKLARVVALILADLVLLNLAQFLALYIRFEFSMSALEESGFLDSIVRFAPAYSLMCILIFALFGLYNSLWAYVSMKEAVHTGEAAALAGLLQYILLSVLKLPVPRSFPAMNILLLAFFIVMERFAYRLIRTVYQKYGYDRRVRTLLIGAGAAGDMVIRELSTSPRSHNRVVCIIDDDRKKHGLHLAGVPVVGGRDKIAETVARFRVSEIIFAIPSCTHSQRREILSLCQNTGCPIKTLPGLVDIANGKVTVQKLRKVDIEDLLGRDSVRVNSGEIGEHIQGKSVLVTGGGGSIGSELCRQVAKNRPGKLIIFDIYENNAYAIQQELLRTCPGLDLAVLIGSVRDKKRVRQIFDIYRPEIVYHAAAHKHVPLMEDSPNEAVKNNVFGTYNVAQAAMDYGVETFVLISSDKAVNPTNVMGATKRICEMIIQMFARRAEKTRFVGVRFGNVLGSNGSVIPLFRRQIESGGPVTVTHRDIIRYFMTIPEAVSLVMQAGVYAKGGEIFVLDMGDPVRIDDLARKMIRLSGLEPDVDIKIEYIGLRPGEKLYEELLMSEEGLEKTANNLIFVGHPNGFSDEELEKSLDRLYVLCEDNAPDITDAISAIVKTYHREGELPPAAADNKEKQLVHN